MTKNELKNKLIELSIPHFYNLDGAAKSKWQDDEHVLDYDAKKKVWEVYVFERGEKYRYKTFLHEEDACNEIFERILESFKYCKK